MPGRVLVVWWVVMMIWVVGSVAQTKILSCPYEVVTPGVYELAESLTFAGDACITVSADNVILSSAATSISYTGSNTNAVGILIFGSNVQIRSDVISLSGACVEVHGSSAKLPTLNIDLKNGGSSNLLALWITANDVSVAGGSIGGTTSGVFTGIRVQDCNNANIGRFVIQGSGGSTARALIMDNVKGASATASINQLLAQTTIQGALVTHSERVTVSLGAASIVTSLISSFNFVTVVNCTYATILSQSGGGFSLSSAIVFDITDSRHVFVSGTVPRIAVAAGSIFGARVLSSQNVTFDSLSLDLTGINNVVYGIQMTQCSGVQVSNTDMVITRPRDGVDPPREAIGVFVDGGFGIFENNTILLDATTKSVGINLTNIDFDNSSFAHNEFDADTQTLIHTPDTFMCSSTALHTPWTCFPYARYPCCASTCLPQVNNTKLCRQSINECDVSDYCSTPNRAWCAVDAFEPTTKECGAQMNDCGPRDSCAGDAAFCKPAPPPCEPVDIGGRGPGFCNVSIHTCECTDKHYTYPNCTWQCNDRVCDYAERCFDDCYPQCQVEDCYPADGECCDSNTCRFKTDLCRPSAAPCDQPEHCSGNNVTCPPDILYPENIQHICNRSDACTKPTTCDGVSNLCPPLTQVECGGFCGDGICQVYETCRSCYLDCAYQCPPPPCPGNPQCSGHGECKQGVCFCRTEYTGPACAESAVPVNVSNNGTNIKTENVSFQISISRVFELEVNDVVAAEYVLADREFNGTHEVLGSESERWNTSTQLPNRASMRLTSWIFYQATEIQFANTTIPMGNFTLKNLVRVANWPFVKLQNRLVFEYVIANTDPNACVSTDFQLDENNNVMYFSFQSGSVSLYCQLVRTIILDGKYVDAQFRVEGNRLQVIVPHFWISVEVDPNFSVLIDNDKSAFNTRGNSCDQNTSGKGNSSVDGILLAKIIVPIVGVALLVVVAITVVYPRVHTWYMTKKGKEHLGNQLDSSPSFDGDQSFDDEQI